MSISLGGYGAGPHETEEHPLGENAEGALHAWMFETPEENRAEIEAITGAGAYVMGRHIFGPVRGPWTGDWRGWWGPNPPYRAPVFVLTHHPRDPLAMDGGTTFHFVTDGVEAAVARAQEAAGDRRVHIAGGPATTNQALAAGLVDELRLQIAPTVLGAGERLFDGVGPLDLEPLEIRAASLVTHVRYRVRRPGRSA